MVAFLSMRMQVILDSLFASQGSALTGGGKKGKLRDWTIRGLDLEKMTSFTH